MTSYFKALVIKLVAVCIKVAFFLFLEFKIKKRGSRLILKVRPSTCTHKHNPRLMAWAFVCLLPVY